MLRIASVLLVAVLLTTCIISGAFAKYVTTDESVSDIAQVAKWGVTVTIEGEDAMFDASYAALTGADYAATIPNTVVSSTTNEMIAPGTAKTNVASIVITGTPEVAVNVTKTANLDLQGWTVTWDDDDDEDTDPVIYCPIVFTIGKTASDAAPTVLNGLDYDTTAAFEAAVEAAILAGNGNYAAKTNLADTNAATDGANQLDVFVSWSWAFADGHDVEDTALGNLAVTAAPTVELTLGATVTQID